MILTSDKSSNPDSPTVTLRKDSPGILRGMSHRGSVNAGDLHSMAGFNDTYPAVSSFV